MEDPKPERRGVLGFGLHKLAERKAECTGKAQRGGESPVRRSRAGGRPETRDTRNPVGSKRGTPEG